MPHARSAARLSSAKMCVSHAFASPLPLHLVWRVSSLARDQHGLYSPPNPQEWWLGFDFTASSNGIIGGHANNPRPKPGISNSTLASVQGNVVLLVAQPVALQSTGRRSGELVPIEILLSNFTFAGSPAWEGHTAELVWTAAVDGRNIDSGTINATGVSIVQGSTGPLAVFGVDVPKVAEATTVSVTVELHLAGTSVAANQWELAVFPPRVAATVLCSVPVLADSTLLVAAKQICPNATVVSPQSLAAQTAPFVLLLHGGLPDAATAAALSRVGGFALLLNPTTTGSWPVCSGSSSTVKPPEEVPLAQPWWLSNECWPTEQSWMTGTLVYNTSLTMAFGREAVAEEFLAYNYGRLMNSSHVYTLDTLSAAMGVVVHVRAIPSDGVYATGGGGGGYQTMVANNALVWEGRLPATASGGGGGGGRFLVSGLNLFNGNVLSTDAAAEHVFDRLLAYAVAETADAPTPLPASTAQPVVTGAATRGCNISGSFCTVGSEQLCRGLSSGSEQNLCNANFEIVVPACLQAGGTLDSLFAQVQVRVNGTHVIGLVYDTAPSDPPGGNGSFCAASPTPTSAAPRRLVAKGTAVAAAAGPAAWLQLPLPPTPLPAGTYWIGIFANTDINCFHAAAAVPPPAVGPGALDAYVARPFGAGPGLGPELHWSPGQLGISVYATTAAASDV